MRRGGVFAGGVLIVLGLLFLAGNLGILPVISWAVVGPVFLVALGLWIITAATGRTSAAASAEPFSIPLEAARAARVVVHHGAGRLDIRGGAPAGVLVDGSGAGGVRHRESRSSDAVTATLDPPDWPGWAGGSLDWGLRLTDAVPLALQLKVGASENTVDLTGLRVSEFELETGASSARVLLPASGVVRARIECGAASVRVEVPPTMAARIVARGGLANIAVAGRFVRVGDAWESPGYAAVGDRIEISAEVGVGEIRID